MQSRNALRHKNLNETLHHCAAREREGKENQGGARVWVYARMELCEQRRNYVFSDENIYVHCNNSYNELSGNCADFSTFLARSLARSHSSAIAALGRLEVN